MIVGRQKRTKVEVVLSCLLLIVVYIFWSRPSFMFTTLHVIPAKREIVDDQRQFSTNFAINDTSLTEEIIYAKVRPKPALNDEATDNAIPVLSLLGNMRYKPAKNIDTSVPVVPTGPSVDYANKCPGMLTDITTAPEGSMPLIALASFPRSGNTWTRMLLQVATKYSTGSVYWEYEKDNEWTKKAFPASTVDYHLRTGVCVKTHNFSPDEIKEFDEGTILLIRNPYKSLMSEFFREKMYDKHFSYNKTVKLLKEFWWDYFPMRAYEWRTFYLSWIRNSKRLLVVFYEDLLSNTKYELTRMIQFLGQTPQLHRIQCAMMHYASKQSETFYVGFDPTTPEQHRVIDQYIEDVRRELNARNAKPLPPYKYENVI
ncbi:sialate:O-sulfotransferase 2-like isoform X2 [Apostichopus japonicus]